MERAELAARLGVAGTATRPRSDRRTIIDARDPAAFRAAFARAVASGGWVFVANPDWGSTERRQFEALVAQSATDANRADEGEQGWLMIPTGGSTGGVKLARHDQGTIAAAVAGYQAFFGVGPVNACGVLPLHHIGGLMGWLRCVFSGGDYADATWADWREGRFDPSSRPTGAAVSIVPTQLARLLAVPGGVDWLRGFANVLLGGAAPWPTLLDDARRAELPLVPSYGMTETAAMVAAQRADVFQTQTTPTLALLPHVQAEVGPDQRLRFAGASLFRGYWPDLRDPGAWPTGDWGRLVGAGGIEVGGRMDDLIVTGGEKVDVAEVEAALRDALPGLSLAVLGVADSRWGQRVVLCVEGGALGALTTGEIASTLSGRLAPHKRPRQIVPVTPWPLSAAGKIDRRALRTAVDAQPEA